MGKVLSGAGGRELVRLLNRIQAEADVARRPELDPMAVVDPWAGLTAGA
jgi:hypothetical protein